MRLATDGADTIAREQKEASDRAKLALFVIVVLCVGAISAVAASFR